MKQLTKEQEEYFKDSVIRNDDGSLKVVYHGTNKEFDAFDKDKVRNSLYGKGFYFTDSFDIAASYGENGILSISLKPENVLSCYLNLEKVFDFDQPLTEELLEKTKEIIPDAEWFYIKDMTWDYNNWPYEYREVVDNMFSEIYENPFALTIDNVAKMNHLIINLQEAETTDIYQKMINIGYKLYDNEDAKKDLLDLKKDLKSYPDTLKILNKVIRKYNKNKKLDPDEELEELKASFVYDSFELDKKNYTTFEDVKKNCKFSDLFYILTDGQHNPYMIDRILNHVAKDCDGYKYKDIGSGTYNSLEEIKHTCYVVLEPNNIKSIDNLYPTCDNNFKNNSDAYFKYSSLEDKLAAAEAKATLQNNSNKEKSINDLEL